MAKTLREFLGLPGSASEEMVVEVRQKTGDNGELPLHRALGVRNIHELEDTANGKLVDALSEAWPEAARSKLASSLPLDLARSLPLHLAATLSWNGDLEIIKKVQENH